MLHYLTQTLQSFFPRFKFVVNEHFITLVINGEAVSFDLPFEFEQFEAGAEFDGKLAAAWEKLTKPHTQFTFTRPLVTVTFKRTLAENPGSLRALSDTFRRFFQGKAWHLTISTAR